LVFYGLNSACRWLTVMLFGRGCSLLQGMTLDAKDAPSPSPTQQHHQEGSSSSSDEEQEGEKIETEEQQQRERETQGEKAARCVSVLVGPIILFMFLERLGRHIAAHPFEVFSVRERVGYPPLDGSIRTGLFVRLAIDLPGSTSDMFAT